MRAVQIAETGGPDVLRLVEQPKPTPQPGQVLVKIHAIGVAYPDLLVRSGRYPWMPPLPYVPGNEVTGHVVDANGSTRLGEGQPVFFTSWDMGFAGGLYAEYVAVKETVPWPLPNHVDLDEAAALFNYIVASLLMEHGARGAESSTALLHGVSGGMGTALAELAQLAGMTVFGTAGTDDKCAFARSRGVQHVINYKTSNVVEQVLQLTAGRGVDVIYNHVAGNSFVDDMKMLAPLGLIVSYAALGGMPDADLFRGMRAEIGRSPAVRVIGTHVFDKMPHLREAACETVLSLLAAGEIKPAITTRLPLDKAADAHRLMESRESLGKILLKP